MKEFHFIKIPCHDEEYIPPKKSADSRLSLWIFGEFYSMMELIFMKSKYDYNRRVHLYFFRKNEVSSHKLQIAWL